MASDPPVDREKLQRALEERMSACPMCAGVEWRSGTAPVAMPVLDTPTSIVTEGGHAFDAVTALPVICTGCGFMALYDPVAFFDPDSIR